MKYTNLLALLILALLTISCGGDDDDDDNNNDDMIGSDDDDDMNPTSRLPPAIFDQETYTSSFMLDTDSDGDDDIILGPANGFSTDVLLVNDGTGFFEIQEGAFPTRYQGGDGQTVNITSADFNGDGLPDIIASTIDGRDATFSQSARIHLYLNSGNNTFTDATDQITDGLFAAGWVEWIRTGDFNNDGNIDFVTTAAGLSGDDLANENFVGGYIYLNDGSANFSRTTINMDDNGAVGAYTSDVLVWDAGNRGDLDRYPLDIFAGDVDNDGDTDLVASNGFADGLWPTFINISTGTDVSFEVRFSDTNENGDPFDDTVFKNGALIDMNNDGLLDVVGSNAIAGPPGSPKVAVEAFVNDGNGTFVLAGDLITGTPPGSDHARQWLVADFNGDGADDLFIADHGYDAFPFPGFRNTLLLSSGGVLADNSSNVGIVNGFTHGAAVGDIDNDGDLDLFMNNHQGLEGIGGATAESFIYLNNGSGVFTAED